MVNEMNESGKASRSGSAAKTTRNECPGGRPHANEELEMIRTLLILAGIMAPLWAFPSRAWTAPDDFAEGTPGQEDGATREFYNRRGMLPWRNPQGDWRDAREVPQGNEPFAAASVARQSEPQTIEWDVTQLARQWIRGERRHKGIVLRNLDGRGSVQFHSREADAPENRPQLVVSIDGRPQTLIAIADTFLEPSTYRGQGNRPLLAVNGEMPALLRFDLSRLDKNVPVDRATLRLVSFRQYSPAEIGVFVCDQGEEVEPAAPILGIAADFPLDRGLENHPQVLFATGFEAEDWRSEWTSVGNQPLETVASHPEAKFEPHSGKACRVLLAKGELTAMNVHYKFQREHGFEPEEIYFRYYLRFGDDWRPTVQGGKMPGIAGTYGRAGWGGRKVNGRDGWSARGSFGLMFPEGNPLAGKQPLGFYCYHADMRGTYGDIWNWSGGYRGFLDNNRWYCIEQYARLNTVGKDGERGENDGILRVWIDGRPAFEKTDLRLRDVERLKIEEVWMNVYHGGTAPAPHDMHLFIDNVVIAKSYIGPMNATGEDR
jgi:hypothetical protein